MLEYLLPIAVIASSLFSILLLLLPSRYNGEEVAATTTGVKPKVSVQVLVLGDIGRSPRMQYHAASIAKHGGRVDLIGYNDSPLNASLQNNPLVTIHALSPTPPLLTTLQRAGLPFLLLGPLKVLHQSLHLLHTLLYTTPPASHLLIQNPPAIPVLFLSILASRLRHTHLIIDWHNYGYSILAGTKGPAHPFVKIARKYEQYLGRWADTNFTVTSAMARQLARPPFNITAPILTLHDRPAEIFQPISSTEARREFLARLPETSAHAEAIMAGTTKLLVSSTSWTPDEDFGLLLDALVLYASHLSSPAFKLPKLLILVTGKGPLKASYVSLISTLTTTHKLRNISIATPWLTAHDYALLLASADLGISLHKSSSGVDLPMKVVDMFGAGLPVLGYAGYESWGELVREGENGRGFETAGELEGLLGGLLGGEGEGELERLREGAREEGGRRWDVEWDGVAGKVLRLL